MMYRCNGDGNRQCTAGGRFEFETVASGFMYRLEDDSVDSANDSVLDPRYRLASIMQKV